MRMKWIATSSTATWCGKVPQPTEASPQLSVTHHRQQTIDGFGGCFNEIGWRVLEALSEDRRTQILRDLFDPASGCGYRLCRVPIGANDYALEWYSHNECDGDLAMEHFSIARDHRYLIPYIRAAMSIQPDLRLFASPWSPPTWMKQPRVYNYGVLRWEPEILKAYALYLLRFVQAYQAEGLPVHQLHIQNEPDSDQKFPSCIWTGAKMRDFIRDYLGPRFRQTGVACEIWAGTIERPDYDAWAHTILVDPHARAFVSGVGYQWAGKGAVQRTHQSWPALRLLQTESECGDGTNTWDYAHYVFTVAEIDNYRNIPEGMTIEGLFSCKQASHYWPGGGNSSTAPFPVYEKGLSLKTSDRCVHRRIKVEFSITLFRGGVNCQKTLLHHYLSNGANGYVYWNMVLPPGGRSTWSWTQNSMVTVDTTQQTVTYNPEFYVMKHLAHFVAPGSVRLDLQGPWSGNALAFQTPDRSTVVVCANPFSEQAEVVIDVASERFFLRLDARSFNTIVLDG